MNLAISSQYKLKCKTLHNEKIKVIDIIQL